MLLRPDLNAKTLRKTYVRNIVVVREKPGPVLAILHENAVLDYEEVSWRQRPVGGRQEFVEKHDLDR